MSHEPEYRLSERYISESPCQMPRRDRHLAMVVLYTGHMVLEGNAFSAIKVPKVTRG